MTSFTPINRSQSHMMARTVTLGPQPISTTVLPDRYRSIFKFSAFNDMQSICFSTLYQNDINTVISSPTGSGKTVLFELAMLRTLVSKALGNFKIIYIAPTKSLCYERYQDWCARLAVLGMKCGFLTGDTSAEEVATVKQADVIITTPEKWDSTTRRWTDYDLLMTLVKLVLIDEVHILKDLRGATLEVVVSRMKYIAPHARFIALSATIPNAEDIAEWLGQNWNSRSMPAQLYTFGEEFRPVQLDIHVYGYPARTANTFQLDKLYDGKLPDILDAHFAQKPIIIFCPTRKSTVSTAKILAKTWMKSREAILACRMDPGRHFQDYELDELSKSGVAYHHAGLSLPDRVMVERMFLGRKILIICCTSTLSVGINLPAHLVVIRGTSAWIDGQVQEYTEFDMHQMMGRAGRPQFDTSGVAVIMTTRDKQSKYEQILCGQEVVESCLHNHLVEHLNAEVCLKTINDIESAKGWLRSTFLYVRMKKNPSHYDIGITGPSKTIEDSLDQLCTENIARLQISKIVETSDRNELVSTVYGRSMALFYIQFQTMLNFMNAGAGMSISDILTMLGKSSEFKNFRFKQGEKKFYKEINAGVGIRYPLKPVDIKDFEAKVSLIIQFTLGRMEFPVYDGSGKHVTQFHADKAIVWQHVQRLIRCIIDCKIQSIDGVSVRNALELARSLQAEIWDNSANGLLQIDGVGPATLRKFLNSNIQTFADLASMDTLGIESVLSLNKGRGMKYLQDVEKIPRFAVTMKTLGETRDTSSVKIAVQVAVKMLNKNVVKMYNRKLLTVGFLVELSNGELVEFRRAIVHQMKNGNTFVVGVKIRSLPTTALKCRCAVSCEELVGTQTVQELQLTLQPESIRMLQSLSQRKITEFQKQTKSSQASDPGKSLPNGDRDTKHVPQISVPFDDQLNFSSDSLLDDEDFERLDEQLRTITNSYPTVLDPGNDITLDSDDERELNEPIITKQDTAPAQSIKQQSTGSKRCANEAVMNENYGFTTKLQKFAGLCKEPLSSKDWNLRFTDIDDSGPNHEQLLIKPEPLATLKDCLSPMETKFMIQNKNSIDDSENDAIDTEQTTEYESSHTSVNIDDLFQLMADLRHRRQKNNVTTVSQDETEFERTQFRLARDSSYSETDGGVKNESKSSESRIEFCAPIREHIKDENLDRKTNSFPGIEEYVDYVEEGANEIVESTVVESGSGFANIADFLRDFVDIVN